MGFAFDTPRGSWKEINGICLTSQFTGAPTTTMYQLHPSKELRDLFAGRPYQGADPSQAAFLFVGLDANYAPDLEQAASYRDVLEYHADGVAFWQRHGVHHPFLRPAYRGDGRRYHQSFSRIGFTREHAHLISFVELLHVATVGRSNLEPSDLNVQHLNWLNQLIVEGEAEHVFISATVARLMRATRAFPWLSKEPTGADQLKTLYKDGSRTVYSHLHFSNYGKFQRQLEAERLAIAALLR